jgi:hypothetical protein
MAYANYINEEARLSGSTAYWIKLLPWSRHALRWGQLLNAPPTHPGPELPTSILIHLILILLMRRIQPLLRLCLV